MTKTAALPALLVMLLALSARGSAQQQTGEAQQFVVNAALAKTGQTVWSAKGCMACHTIGKGGIDAPDLNGLYNRRSRDWVKSWLKNPEPMFELDEAVKKMVQEWNNIRMPNMKLSDAEVEAVMHYIAEQQKPRK